MKQTTNDWFIAAEDDLFAAKKLATEDRLTNVVSFHCQQCLEKCFKAIIEEKGLTPLNVHLSERMKLLINFINTDKVITVEELAIKCAVSDKTIKRDIDFLKNKLIKS